MGREGFPDQPDRGRAFTHASLSAAWELHHLKHMFSLHLAPWASFPFIHRLLGGLAGAPALKTCPRVPSARGGTQEAAPFPGDRVETHKEAEGPDSRTGKEEGRPGPGALTARSGREEFFAGFLKELLLRLRDQVPSELG